MLVHVVGQHQAPRPAALEDVHAPEGRDMFLTVVTSSSRIRGPGSGFWSRVFHSRSLEGPIPATAANGTVARNPRRSTSTLSGAATTSTVAANDGSKVRAVSAELPWLCPRAFAGLPSGASVATSAVRRTAADQPCASRPRRRTGPRPGRHAPRRVRRPQDDGAQTGCEGPRACRTRTPRPGGHPPLTAALSLTGRSGPVHTLLRRGDVGERPHGSRRGSHRLGTATGPPGHRAAGRAAVRPGSPVRALRTSCGTVLTRSGSSSGAVWRTRSPHRRPAAPRHRRR